MESVTIEVRTEQNEGGEEERERQVDQVTMTGNLDLVHDKVESTWDKKHATLFCQMVKNKMKSTSYYWLL